MKGSTSLSATANLTTRNLPTRSDKTTQLQNTSACKPTAANRKFICYLYTFRIRHTKHFLTTARLKQRNVLKIKQQSKPNQTDRKKLKHNKKRGSWENNSLKLKWEKTFFLGRYLQEMGTCLIFIRGHATIGPFLVCPSVAPSVGWSVETSLFVSPLLPSHLWLRLPCIRLYFSFSQLNLRVIWYTNIFAHIVPNTEILVPIQRVLVPIHTILLYFCLDFACFANLLLSLVTLRIFSAFGFRLHFQRWVNVIKANWEICFFSSLLSIYYESLSSCLLEWG